MRISDWSSDVCSSDLTTPAEAWDYNASMDMQVATLEIDGAPRKALLQAPKNGFFYVIDRTNGKLISAEPFAKVTWASKIDLTTGRPVEIDRKSTRLNSSH